MCFSIEVSLITGIVSYVIAYYLWKRNYKYDRWFSIIIFTFSTVQWVDALLWYDLKHNNKGKDSKLNMFLTTFILPFLFAVQPLSVLLAGIYKGYNIKKFELSIYVMYSIFLLLYLSRSSWLHGNPKVTRINKECNLDYGGKTAVWSMAIFLIAVAIPARFLQLKAKIIGILAIVVPLIIVTLTRHAIKSLWCLSSNSLSLLALLYPYL